MPQTLHPKRKALVLPGRLGDDARQARVYQHWGSVFGAWGLGFGVWGLGFGECLGSVWGLEFRVWGVFGVWGLRSGLWGLGFDVFVLAFRNSSTVRCFWFSCPVSNPGYKPFGGCRRNLSFRVCEKPYTLNPKSLNP